MNEDQEYWKRAEDNIQEMCHENLELFKEYMISMEDNLFIL